jgi:hypothetical protein
MTRQRSRISGGPVLLDWRPSGSHSFETADGRYSVTIFEPVSIRPGLWRSSAHLRPEPGHRLAICLGDFKGADRTEAEVRAIDCCRAHAISVRVAA